MGWVVKFEGVSKRYRGGGPRYGSLRHDLSHGFRRLGVLFGRSGAEPQGKLALDDVSFEVEQGESFAIVGPNGAGKTTALRIISRITYPTGGRVRVRGRVGALIEVGSGVHPELTARENIWLYGQILGMSRRDIRRRFDEIVEFAELADALEVPVKMYSSGMQLRLGFSIASHLDPDVFVVDEALAVGDAGFQAKCVERMTKLVVEGRTLLFVSHNLSAVEAICRRGIFLLGGHVQRAGAAQEVLRTYLEWVDDRQRRSKGAGGRVVGRGLVIDRVTVHDAAGVERYVFETGEPLEIRLHVLAEQGLARPWFSVGLTDGRPGALVLCSMLEGNEGFDLAPGRHVISCRMGSLPLGPRVYELYTAVREVSGAADLLDWSPVGAIRISLPECSLGPNAITASWMYGPVRVSHSWSLGKAERELD
jgi:ABC-type polysaccharide/polyol phosphate transport system ATPase subunit